MYTQCPRCMTVYLLDAPTLGASRGDMRCGKCRAVFCALDAIADEPPGDGMITPTFPSTSPPVLEAPDGSPDEAPAELPLLPEDLLYFDVPEAERITTPEDFDASADLSELDWDEETLAAFKQVESAGASDEDGDDEADWADVDPDEVLHAVQRDREQEEIAAPAGPWRAVAALLALALIGQTLWWERGTVLANPTTRGWLEALCDAVGCTLPLRRDVARIRLASRDIRPHPSVEGALIVNATLHNQADFRQPYPAVQIRLSDLQGNAVAARRFAPEDYLERADLAADGMPPRTMVPLVFEVVDPGNEAVAFEFDFL